MAETFRAAGATVGEVLEWHKVNCPLRSTSKKAEKERQRLYALFAAEFGEMLCADARPHHLLTFINERAGENNWTRKRWNSTLQRPFNFAASLGLLASSPFKGLTMPEGENGRDWTEAEYLEVMRNAKPHFRRFLVMIRFSGMRPGEIRALQWRHVKMATLMIVLDEHKTMARTKRPRQIPLNHVTVKLLLWLKRNNPPRAKAVFTNSFYQPLKMKAVTDTLAKIRAKTGLPAGVKCHGGRHFFATRAIVNGVDVATLGELLGHTSISTTQRYMHLADKSNHLASAMEKAIASPAQGKGGAA